MQHLSMTLHNSYTTHKVKGHVESKLYAFTFHVYALPEPLRNHYITQGLEISAYQIHSGRMYNSSGFKHT